MGTILSKTKKEWPDINRFHIPSIDPLFDWTSSAKNEMSYFKHVFFTSNNLDSSSILISSNMNGFLMNWNAKLYFLKSWKRFSNSSIILSIYRLKWNASSILFRCSYNVGKWLKLGGNRFSLFCYYCDYLRLYAIIC